MNNGKQTYSLIAAAFVLFGGYWALLQAEDRWNQAQDIANIYSSLKNYQSDLEIMFLEKQLKDLNSELFYLKINIKEKPNIDEFQERLQFLEGEIYRTKRMIEKMKRSEREIEND